MNKKSKIYDFEEIRERQNRPPNIIDAFLIEVEQEGVPLDREEYKTILDSQEVYEKLKDHIKRAVKFMPEDVYDLLVRESVIYAIERSPGYAHIYKDKLKIADKDRIVRWVKENIKSRDDLEHLPTITGSDLINLDLYPYGFVPPEKFELGLVNFQSGGTTGKKPKIIFYSDIDEKVAVTLMSACFEKYANLKKGDKALIFGPSDPHLFAIMRSLLPKAGICPIWKHFGARTTEELLEDIKDKRPDLLATAPHGKKGSIGALDVLVKVDQEMGEDILSTYMKDKKIFSAGAPMSAELAETLYDDIGIDTIINGYGGGEIGGFFSNIKREDLKDKGFISNVEYLPGYWEITLLEDEEVPEGWSSYAVTVVGREGMPIIKYDQGDYAKVNIEKNRLEDICRKDWFAKREDGKYEVRIPSQVYTCISEV